MRSLDIESAMPSRSETDDPALFHDKLFLAHKIDQEEASGQFKPGRMWQSLAENMLVNNVEREVWGWADTRVSHLLDFWADVDQSINFLLCYVAPEVALAMMPDITAATEERRSDALAFWRRTNSELLDFYSRNRHRCLLLNTYALIRHPVRLEELLAERLGIQLSGVKQECKDRFEFPVSAIRSLLARRLLSHSEAEALYEELETASDLPVEEDHEQFEIAAAWSEHSRLMATEKLLQETCADAVQDQQSLEDCRLELTQARRQIRETDTQLKTAEQQVLLLQEMVATLETTLGQARLNEEEQRKEIDLQLIQLREVQEELDESLKALEKTTRSLEQAREQIKESDVNNQAAKEEQSCLLARISTLDENLGMATQKGDALEKENELLLLQLHQVQEEVENYYRRVQEADNKLQQQAQELEKTQELGNIWETEAKETQSALEEAKRQLELAKAQARDANARITIEEQKASQLCDQVGAMEKEIGREQINREELGNENDLLLLQLHQVQEELETYYSKYNALLKKNQDNQKTIPTTQYKPVTGGVDKVTTGKVGLINGYLEKYKSARRLKRQVSVIRSSGLFDEQWYLNEYPDVSQSGMDPIRHYLKFGAEEGRDPSLQFDTRYYQHSNPDIADSAINPLIHYLAHGQAEGRCPHP